VLGIRLDPITRRRLERFRRIRRGYYSLLILGAGMALSIIAPYLAESRAVLLRHEGRLYLPTFRFLPMSTFGQEPPAGWETNDVETDYFRLKREWQLERELYERDRAGAGNDPSALAVLEERYPNRRNRVLMPVIPWNPYETDFWYNEILNDVQARLDAGDAEGAARLARRDGLDELADAISTGPWPTTDRICSWATAGAIAARGRVRSENSPSRSSWTTTNRGAATTRWTTVWFPAC